MTSPSSRVSSLLDSCLLKTSGMFFKELFAPMIQSLQSTLAPWNNGGRISFKWWLVLFSNHWQTLLTFPIWQRWHLIPLLPIWWTIGFFLQSVGIFTDNSRPSNAGHNATGDQLCLPRLYIRKGPLAANQQWECHFPILAVSCKNGIWWVVQLSTLLPWLK